VSGLILGWSPRHAGAADPGSIVPLPSDVKAELDKYLGAGVVGAPLESPPLMTAADYLPSKGVTLTYLVVEEGEKARSETHKGEDTTNPQFAPGLRYTADPMGALYFQQSKDGGATIAGEEDRDNEVVSRFTPGEPLMIPGLKAGESRKIAVKVQVAALSNPKK